MWNEEIDVSEHMLRVAKVSCPILRKEVSKSFAQVFSAIREALRWHLILMQRQTILMLRLGLRKTILALAFQQRKGIAACESPVVNGSDSPNEGDKRRAWLNQNSEDRNEAIERGSGKT